MYTTSTIVLLRLKELKRRKQLTREQVINVAEKYDLIYFFLPDSKGLLKKENTFSIQFKITN